jgi:hypothetical protein
MFTDHVRVLHGIRCDKQALPGGSLLSQAPRLVASDRVSLCFRLNVCIVNPRSPLNWINWEGRKRLSGLLKQKVVLKNLEHK